MSACINKFDGRWRFLSNFHLWVITYDDIDYPTIEHAFQAAKTLNPAFRRYIAGSINPNEAKRRGRAVPLRPGWDTHIRYMVMEELLKLKFAPDRALAPQLLETGDSVLIEGNRWHDNLWGDCHCGRKACAQTGANLLGWMLMRRRALLKAQVAA